MYTFRVIFSAILLFQKIILNTMAHDSNEIQTHNHLVRKRTLNHLAKLTSLAKWLSVRLRTKWLWVRIPLLSLKLQIWRLLRARSSLTFSQTIECGFTLKLVRDMIITYSTGNGTYVWSNMRQMLQANKNSNIKYNVIQVKLKKTYQIKLEYSIIN